MERNFSNENMEEFLRRNAEGLRMRPSAKVWKGISSQLNRRRRRIGLILGTSLLLTTTLGYYLANQPSKNYHDSSLNFNYKTEKNISKEIPDIKRKLNSVNTPVKNNTNAFSLSTFGDQEFTFPQTLPQRYEEGTKNTFIPSILDSYFENDRTTENSTNNSDDIDDINVADPLSIESVLNTYKPKTRKLSWQTYFTPTVSYRKLSDHAINNIVPHRPAFGFELGVAAKYPVSRKAKLRAGLQFNVNRYEIKTYDSYTQLATIRLVDKNGVDYVRTTTNYNNFSGYQTNWLQNSYIQLSAPLGIEVNLSGDDKVQFGVASTIQPTYLLGDKTYLISSDYKNYTEMPSLVRHWNVNTSLETFVAYSTGHINWQVGPQVRYQILSSYLKKYPVKENLFDFGLKVGISFNKQ